MGSYSTRARRFTQVQRELIACRKRAAAWKTVAKRWRMFAKSYEDLLQTDARLKEMDERLRPLEDRELVREALAPTVKALGLKTEPTPEELACEVKNKLWALRAAIKEAEAARVLLIEHGDKVEAFEARLTEYREKLAAAEAQRRKVLKQLDIYDRAKTRDGLDVIRQTLARNEDTTALDAALEAHLRQFIQVLDEYIPGLMCYYKTGMSWSRMAQEIRQMAWSDAEEGLREEHDAALERARDGERERYAPLVSVCKDWLLFEDRLSGRLPLSVVEHIAEKAYEGRQFTSEYIRNEMRAAVRAIREADDDSKPA